MKGIGTKWQEKILWGILILIVATQITKIVGSLLGLGLERDILICVLELFLPVMILLLHSVWALGYLRGFAFILIASLTGFIFEVLGVKYGVGFGGHYVYQNSGLALLDVPLLVPLYWAVFIYTGYNITSSFLFWVGVNKPHKRGGGAVLLPLLVFLDGLIVVAVDLLLDPLQVQGQGRILVEGAPYWFWRGGGPYYDIPIGNFVSWFMVVAIATSIFRVFEYFVPQKVIKVDRSVFLIPVVGYGVLCSLFFFTAVRIQLPELALVGVFTMLPVMVANLILFTVWRRGRKIRGEGSK